MADKTAIISSDQAQALLTECVMAALREGASDIHLAPYAPPRIRLHGRLINLKDRVLLPAHTEAMFPLLLSKDNQNELGGSNGVADFATNLCGDNRFRGNICKTQKGFTIALRHLLGKIPAMEDLGLPTATLEGLLGRQKGGLILVTGPTGSGKTTSLASMIDRINTRRAHHIITIESPIEFIHAHKMSNVDQRELPLDSPSFPSAIRDALRQDPDVIMVGEMRDLETIGAALTAAETGHLVFSTLHTNSAAETINRIIDAFPQNQQQQIRTQLATSLIAVLSQRLLPLKDGSGRVAAYELMITTSAVQSHIRENKTIQITSDIETGGKEGMVSFDDSLIRLVQADKVSMEVALTYALHPKDFQSRLR